MTASAENRNADAPGRSASESVLEKGVRDFIKQMIAIGERAEPLRRLLAHASVRAESAGGEVAVIVTVDGALIGVDFGEGHESVPEEQMAELILGTYDRALAEAERRRLA